MVLIPHYFHYIQFNLAGVKYVYVKTVRLIASVQPGFRCS